MAVSTAERTIPAAEQEKLASYFASLHKPSSPVLLSNVWDIPSARAVIAHPKVKAVATASYAIAAVHGVSDPQLTYEQNITSIRSIASVVVPSGKPLTADVQDGYKDVASTIRDLVNAGVVGCNIEDIESVKNSSGGVEERLRNDEDAIERIKAVKRTAAELGVPNFVVNARTDTVLFGGTVEAAIERGKKFLEAGANTVFIWGGPKRGLRDAEVRQISDALGGMANIKINLGEAFLTSKQVAGMGIARISVGPEIFLKSVAATTRAVDQIFEDV